MDYLWTGPQVAEILGISYDTLNYWVQLGLITPSQPADRPRGRSYFSFPDLVTIAAIKSLRDQKISLQMIRKASTEFSQRIGMSFELGLRGGVIVADNKQLLAILYTLDEAVQIMALLKGGQFLLPLDQIVESIQSKIEEKFGYRDKVFSSNGIPSEVKTYR